MTKPELDLDDGHAALRAKVGLYFDGELAAEAEPDVLDHLADCEVCQAELGDVVGIHVGAATPREPVLAAVTDASAEAARGTGPRADAGRVGVEQIVAVRGDPARAGAMARAGVTPLRSRRRGYVIAGVVVMAAAVLAFVMWPRPHAEPTLALAPTRAIEARFEAGPFAAYRPYAVMRGAAAREPIALDALARLGRGDPAVLAAALASSGDVVRARELAAGSPSDRAAVALVAGQPEEALALLDGAATTPAAHWNLALAARGLGLAMVARAHFAEVAAAGEPGWRDEAARQVATLDQGVGALAAADRAFVARAAQMIAGTGPAITASDAAQFPARARIALLDALRVLDRDAVRSLAPVADALDRGTHTTDARAALDRVAAARFDVRARFATRYRAIVAGTSSPADAAALVAELRAAGRDVDDVRLGALIWRPQLAAPGELARLAQATHDPWFELHATRLQLAEQGAVGKLVQATDACAEVWAYRCAQLASDAAYALSEVGRDDDAIRYATKARALYAAAATPDREAEALGYLGELERYRDRRALARATFQEAELRAGDDCRTASYARIGRAKLALVEGKLADARALLPRPDACDAPPDPIALTIAVDVARQSASPADRTAAQAWLAAARRASEPLLAALAEIGEGRLAIAADPRATALTRWLAAHPAAGADADRLAQRAWATDALVSAAGERGDWAAAAEAARGEIAVPEVAGCVVVASVDQDRQVAAVRDAAGAWHGVARRAPVGALDGKTFIPRALSDALAGCPAVHVIARPPLHGNTQLLPPALPWAFVGGPPRAPSARAPRIVIVTDVAPPEPALPLPALAPGAAFPAGAVVIRAAAATPARVLAELAEATYVELDAHGVADAATSDASFLALSPEPSGKFRLTAGDVRGARLGGAVVVLAACRSAQLAPYLHRRWTLPDAFVAAGARAVIATDVDVPDADAGPVFAELRTRITGGESPAAAVAALRARAPASWVARIAVFE